jgi:hypothetical protein
VVAADLSSRPQKVNQGVVTAMKVLVASFLIQIID